MVGILRSGSDQQIAIGKAAEQAEALDSGLRGWDMHDHEALDGDVDACHCRVVHGPAPVVPEMNCEHDARVIDRFVNLAETVGPCTTWKRRVEIPLSLVLLLIAIIAIWVVAKVRYYARLSERQWQRVDKTKLRAWDDDDEK